MAASSIEMKILDHFSLHDAVVVYSTFFLDQAALAALASCGHVQGP